MEDSGLHGVLDTRVRILYRLAKRFVADPTTKQASAQHWRDLITCVATTKPQSLAALCADRARATPWYYELRDLPLAQAMPDIEYVGILMSALDDELKIESDDDES